MRPLKTNEEQYIYSVSGKWKPFDEPQDGLGQVYTFAEVKAYQSQAADTPENRMINAKSTRDAGIIADIELPGTGAMYQVDEKSQSNMAQAIRKAERNGYPGTEKRNWRLSNNTWRETTLAEIKTLLELVDQRWELIWAAYNLWDSGPKDTPFTLE